MTKGKGPNSKGRKRTPNATPPLQNISLPVSETSNTTSDSTTFLYQSSNGNFPKPRSKKKSNSNKSFLTSDKLSSNLGQNQIQTNNSLPTPAHTPINNKESKPNERNTFNKRILIDHSNFESRSNLKDKINSHFTPPISRAPSPCQWGDDSINPEEKLPGYAIFSLWDYFRAELETSEYDPNFIVKRERVSNFFRVPKEFEKLMFFGYCVCLNSVLYNFTILPTRLFMTFISIFKFPYTRKSLNNNQKCDLIRGALICSSCLALSYLDLSRLYHAVRGQSAVKLYVIFNMVEIFDRLAASLGQDLLNAFFAEVTLGRYQESPGTFRLFCQFLASTIYIPLHTAVLFYQMMALNVSVNSYNDALFTLLMSNQFVEIKGSVFKKFERENLFQLTCSDITERFQLTLFLIAITLRNVSAIMVAEGSLNAGYARAVLPTAFRQLVPSTIATGIDLLLSPAVLVLFCEILVDWAKHSFITKFNHLRPSVYSRYMDLLCHDIVTESPTQIDDASDPRQIHTLIDQSPVVARRLGLSVFPLTCLIIRVALQLLDVRKFSLRHTWSLFQNFALEAYIFIINFELSALPYPSWPNLSTNFLIYLVSSLLVFLSLILVKLLLGVHLLRFASRRQVGMADREAADKIATKEDTKENFRELNLIKEQLRATESQDSYRPKNLDLNTVDRFALFKSRVP